MQLKTINNRYEVVRELGHGGMGDVHLVKDLHLDGRLLALKTIRPKAMSEESLERFRVEFKGLSQLSHPNLATARDFGRIAGTEMNFFTSDFIHGVDVFSGTSTASLDQLLDVFAQTLRGMDFIHSHGLLHNDLKPQNILLEKPEMAEQKPGDGGTARESSALDAVGKVKIIDFGLLSAERVAFENIMGTPLYLSPERIRLRPADRRSDLYSLGLVFYALCARVLPFQEKRVESLLRLQLKADPVPLEQFRTDLPHTVIELIRRLTRKAPADRFDSAAQALELLGSELRHEVVNAAAPLSRPEIACGKLLHRSPELLFLENCFGGVANGTVTDCCAAVLGPAGVGKTRLVRELRSLVQVRNGAYLEVGGAAVEGHLRLVLDIVLRGLETSGLERQELQRDRPAALDDATDLAPVLERLLLRSAGKIPVILVFDDFQDASPTVRTFALDLVQAVSQSMSQEEVAPRLFIVISSQTQGSRQPSLPGAAVVRLNPFDERASADFLRSIFEQDDIPEPVLASLTRIAGGNPGLLLELARDLAEKNHVQHNGSRWVFPASIAGVPLLESLPACLEAKVASLDPESRALCEYLSVASLPLTASLLAASLHPGEQHLHSRLEALVEKGILVGDEAWLPGKAATNDAGADGAAPRAYCVACAGTRKLISDRLDGDRRQFLHRRIAQSLEDVRGFPGRDAGRIEALAYHWLSAGNTAAFLRHAQAAALSLHRCGSLTLAADYQRRIVDGMPLDATARKLQALSKLSEARELLWDLEGSRDDSLQILSIGGSLLKPADRASIWRRIAALEMGMGRNDAALAAIESARQAAGANADALSRLALDAAEAWAAWCVGAAEKSREACVRAEQARSGCKPSEPRHRALAAGALNHLGNLHQVQGRLARAVETFQEQLALLDGHNLPQAEAATRAAYGGALLEWGHPAEALTQLRLALELTRRAGDRRTLCRTRLRLGEHHLRHGHLKGALAVTEAALEDAEAAHNPAATAHCLRSLGRIHLRLGKKQEARGLLSQALEAHAAAGDRAGTPLTRLALARLALEEGRPAEARSLALETEAEAERDGLPLAQAGALLVRAEASRLELRWLDRALLESAEAILDASGHRAEAAETRVLAARGALDAGDADGAMRTLSEIDLAAATLETRGRAEYLRALVTAARGDRDRAAMDLRHLRQTARNQVLPGLEAECDQALSELTEAPARLPAH